MNADGQDRVLRAALWQLEPGHFPSRDERLALKTAAPDLVILPEYHAVDQGARMSLSAFIHFDRNLDRLRELAVDLNAVVVGGTVVEKEGLDHFNTCFVYDRRRTAGFYRKIHVTERERAAGITPGSELRVFRAGGIGVGVMVCADALQPWAFDRMRALGADVVAIPTVSPFLLDDTVEAKERRDRDIYVAGAARSGAYVLKVCAARSFLGARLQGRSLAAAPWGILDRVPFDAEAEERLLLVDLPLARLHEQRRVDPAR